MGQKSKIFFGTVVSGAKRGRVLGYQTANLKLHKRILQKKFGIYLAHTCFKKKRYPSIVHIGPALTFNEKFPKFETHIFGWKKNLYGRQISVELIKKIRGTKKFRTAQDLKKQIRKDIQRAKEFFNIQHKGRQAYG